MSRAIVAFTSSEFTVSAPCYGRLVAPEATTVAREATVVALATRRKAGGTMLEHGSVSITTAAGVVDEMTGGADFRGRPGRRQVTVLTVAGWADACAQLGTELAWTARRANILLGGVIVDGDWVIGRHLRVGDALLLITGETEPCARMDQLRPGLRDALAAPWRGGLTCRVVASGTARVGDAAAVLLDAPTEAPAAFVYG